MSEKSKNRTRKETSESSKKDDQENSENDSLQSIIIDDTYSVGEKIGAGSYGLIRLGVNQKTGETVAIKLEKISGDPSQVLGEFKFYQLLSNQKGFPQLYYCGQLHSYNLIIMDMLGKNLETVFDNCNRNFTLKSIIFIALQLLKRFETIHQYKIVYRDVKPENFLLGIKSNTVHVIDFGLSKFFVDDDDRHISRVKTHEIIGTSRYMSLNAHLCYEQSRRDDLEALSYVIIYFLRRGKLPWSGLKVKSFHEHNMLIYETKKNIKEEELCSGFPIEVIAFLRYVRTLGFSEEPNYEKWRNYFKRLFYTEKFVDDGIYDWNKINQ